MSNAPTISFTRMSGKAVVASYANLPPGAVIVFVEDERRVLWRLSG